MAVVEDDVLLADNWQLELKQLIHADTGMLLLGWNLDSVCVQNSVVKKK